jgi:simple sugar transport system permease protein
LQAIGVAIPVEILSMSPYLVTIVVLVGISLFGHQTAPGSLARPFHASQ